MRMDIKPRKLTAREKWFTSIAASALAIYLSATYSLVPAYERYKDAGKFLAILEENIYSARNGSDPKERLSSKLQSIRSDIDRRREIENTYKKYLEGTANASLSTGLIDILSGETPQGISRFTVHSEKPRPLSRASVRRTIRSLGGRTYADQDAASQLRSASIRITYDSSYEDSVAYLEKLGKIPIATSFNSLKIFRGNGKMLSTDIQMEIFFK